jgi:hypothetical protein
MKDESVDILMDRVPSGLSPTTDFDSQCLSQYGIGRTVEIKIRQPRSLPQHRLYWVMLSICVANKDDMYGSKDVLHEVLKVALGYKKKIKTMDGEEITLPGSISFAAMDQAEFKIYFDKAKIVLAGAGYPIEEIEKEANRQLAHVKPYRRKGAKHEQVSESS